MNHGKIDVILAMTGARGICGGIATANLNILQALTRLLERVGGKLEVFSFVEEGKDRPDFLPSWVGFRAFQGVKINYALALLQSTMKRRIFCFDHVKMAFPLLPLSVTRRVKTVIFAHGSESWKRMHWASRWLFQSASLCLTNSYFTLGKMQERISEFRGKACLMGLSPAFQLNSEVPEPDGHGVELEAVDGRRRRIGKRSLLLTARMDRGEGKKGHRELVNILPHLLVDFPDVQLVFPGPGNDRFGLQELARSEGVAGSVFIPGWVSQEILSCLYNHCYVFVMPSQQEGFGLAYLEAMNFGKPCVGCFDQGAEDIIVHGETGFLVRDPSNAHELLEVLRVLLSDHPLARRLGMNGFKRLHQYFTAEHYQERIQSEILEVL
ncbi:MAG: glycosyltransferase family 4 protein [Chlamydiae bacterium]|nr:glycosyltransferase family 4 protein [Chlamydiota bacterium]